MVNQPDSADLAASASFLLQSVSLYRCNRVALQLRAADTRFHYPKSA